MSSRLLRRLTAVVLLHALWPTLVLAQQPAAGVVTGLQGQATVARPVIPQPIPLKYRDDVFLRDRINTRENSIVRVLLGGKALVTVRELSILTITEEPNRAIVDIQLGKVAVGVAKKLLRPGESIEIRTPNAVASVRGSYVVTAVALVAGIPQTTFTALEVSVPITVSPRADPTVTIPLSTNQSVGVTGLGAATSISGVQAITPAQRTEAAQVGSAPKSEDHTTSSPAQAIISNDQVAVAATLVEQLAPPPPPLPPPPQPKSEIIPTVVVTPVRQPVIPDGPYFLVDRSTLQLPAGASLATFTAAPDPGTVSGRDTLSPGSGFPGGFPLVSATGTNILVQGDLQIDGVSHGPVLEMKESALIETDAASPLFKVDGTSLTTSTLLSIVDSKRTTPLTELPDLGVLVNGSFLTLHSSLTFPTTSSLLTASNSSLEFVNTAAALFSLTDSQIGTSAAAGGGSLVALKSGSSMKVFGPTLGTSGSTVVNLAGALVTLSGGSTFKSLGPFVTMSGGALVADALAAGAGDGNTLSVAALLGGPNSAKGLLLDLSNNASVSLRTLVQTPGTDVAVLAPDNNQPLVRMVGSSLSASGNAPLLNLPDGSNVTTTGPIFSLSGGSTLTTTVAGQPLIFQDPSVLILNSPALAATGTSAPCPDCLTISLAGPVLGVVDSKRTTPLLDADNQFVFPDVGVAGTASFMTLEAGASLSFPATSALLTASNSSLNFVNGAPLFRLLDSQIGAPAAPGGGLVDLRGASAMTASGPLLDATGSTIYLAGPLLRLAGASTYDAAGPYVKLSGGALMADALAIGGGDGNRFLVAAVAGSTDGLLLDLTGGASATLRTLFDLPGNDLTVLAPAAGQPLLRLAGGSLTITGTAPLFDVTQGNFSPAGNLVDVGAGSTFDLGGASLVAVSGTGKVEGSTDLLNVTGTFMNGVADGSPPGPVFSVAAGAKLAPAGALLNLSGGGSVGLASALLDLAGGDTGSSPALVQVSGGTLTDTASLFSVSGVSTVNRPLLGVSGGEVTAPSLLSLGADLTLNASLLSLSGGKVTTTGDALAIGARTLDSRTSLIFAVTGGALEVTGALAALGPGSSLALSGTLVGVAGGSVDAGYGAKLDGALIETGAALAAVTGSFLTARKDFVSLAQGSQLLTTAGFPSTEALVRVVGATSAMTVANGHLFNVAGASRLIAGGDLVHLASGATLTITGGTLLNLAGASLVELGTLIRFGAGGGTITVTNTIAPNTFLAGFPIFVAPGAVLTVNTLTPIVGTGTIVVTSGSLLAIEAGSSLRIGPPTPPVVVPVGPFFLVQNSQLQFGATTSLATFKPGSDPSDPAVVSPRNTIGDPNPVVDLSPRTAPLITATGTNITVQGDGSPAGPVIELRDSTLLAGGAPLFDVNGTSLTASRLLVLGSSLTSAGPLLALSGGASATIAGALEVKAGSDATFTGTDVITLPAGTSLATTGIGFDIGGTLTVTGAGSDLVSLSGGSLTLGGALLSQASGSPTTTIGGDALRIASSVTGPSSGSFFSVGAGMLAVAGDLVDITAGSTLNLNGASLASVTGTGTIAVTGDALHVAAGATVTNASGASPVFSVAPGGTLTAGGAFLDSGGSVSLKSALLDLGGGSTGNGATALVQVTGGSLSDTANLLSVSGATMLGRPLLSLSGGSLLAADVLNVGASLTTPANLALLQASGGLATSLSATGRLATVSGSGTDLTLNGALFASTGATLTTKDDFFGIFNGALAKGETTDTLIQLLGTTLTAGSNGQDTQLVRVRGVSGGRASTLTLKGALIQATDSAVTVKGDDVLEVISGARLTGTGAGALLQLTNTPLTVSGRSGVSGLENGLLDVSGSGSEASLKGALLAATDSPLKTELHFLFVDGSGKVKGEGGGAFLELTRSALEAGTGGSGDFLRLSGHGSLELAGALLSATDSPVSAKSDFLNITGSAGLIASANPLIELNRSPLAAGRNGADTHFLHLAGTGSLVSLAGGLLKATDSPLSVRGDDFLEIRDGGRLVSTGPTPLVELLRSPLTTVAGSGCFGCPQAFLHLFGTGGGFKSTLEIAGSLLTATGSPLTLTGEFLYIHSGGQLKATSTTEPVIGLSGGAHSATRLANLDAALLEASTPLLRLTNGGSLTTTQDTLRLAQQATVKVNGNPVILLDGSTLTLSRGALASVTGGSTLTATGGNGALVLMKNGSTLNIGNQLSPGRDTLLILSGASTVSLKFLVKFEGALLNTINVWNTLAPTTFISGIPIRIEGGMTSNNTFNIGSNPISGLNSSGNRIFINGTALPNNATTGVTGSLILVSGTRSTVKIQ